MQWTLKLTADDLSLHLKRTVYLVGCILSLIINLGIIYFEPVFPQALPPLLSVVVNVGMLLTLRHQPLLSIFELVYICAFSLLTVYHFYLDEVVLKQGISDGVLAPFVVYIFSFFALRRGWALGVSLGLLIVTSAVHLQGGIPLNQFGALLVSQAIVVGLLYITSQARDQHLQFITRQTIAMSSAVQGMAIHDSQGRFLYVNPAHARMYGYESAEALLGQEWEMLYEPAELDRLKAVVMPALAADGHWAGEATARRRDGTTFPQDLTLTLVPDGGLACLVTDITQRKQTERGLLHKARYDALTGLPNRGYFLECLQTALAVTEQARTQIALLFVDLDNFKMVNDTFGHEAGDRLLLEVVRRLETPWASGVVTVGRMGGDEFVILLGNAGDMSAVTGYATEVLRKVSEPAYLGDVTATVSCSIGIALAHAGSSLTDLLRYADMAMYKAKGSGKNAYAIFQPELEIQMQSHMSLVEDLRAACDKGQFALYYQPIADTRSGKVTAMEALLRWQHPDRGTVAPADFIPLAEESGLIIPIGRWVLEEGCRQLAQWKAELPQGEVPTLCINLSVRQMQDQDLVEYVASLLMEHQLDPGLLQLEVTETTLMVETEQSTQWLQRFQSLGVQLALDDFGVGYSSVGYLRRFPFQVLKVDRSFVCQAGGRGEPKALLAAVIQLGRALNLVMTAEGVETAAQMTIAQQLGFDRVQGYFIARPLPSAQATELLLTRTAGGAVI